ncbi:MAG TPA: antibiotic ABC transporter permease [Actinobacteria bacterium]|nr:antibiotic ABC transporter permease [Actinomycetota bacterium]
MKKFWGFIIKHKKWIVIFFALMMIPSIIGNIKTEINYDMASYLPEELNSVKGNKILSEEFGLSNTLYLLLHDKELWDVAELKEELASVQGIDEVTWLSDYTDINVPRDFIPKEIKDQFISGKSTILQIQINSGPQDAGTGTTIEKIQEIAGDGAYLGGESVMGYELKQILDDEQIIYFIIGAITIFIILALSTTSIFEPIIFLLAVGAAIMLNLGSNIIFGNISYMTASIAAIIQLAVSADYSIFLLHRYREERGKNISNESAMISAVSKTSTTVIASGLTTIAGFMALLIMKVSIGRDLGLVLAKGVAFSLITTLVLLPCLILMLDRLISKSKHRIFLPRFNLLSKIMIRGRWVFIALVIILLVPSFMASRNLDTYSSMSKTLPENALSVETTEKIKEEFGKGEIIYVITPDKDIIREKQLISRIKTIPAVDSATGISEIVDMSIPETFIPGELTEKFSNSKYSYFLVQLSSGLEDPGTIEAINEMGSYASEIYDQYYITGEAVLQKDMSELAAVDLKYVSMLSMILIAVILAILFKSASLPVILILIIQLAIWINLSIPFITNRPVYYLTSIFIYAIQLGATVDYAILLTMRYRENLKIHRPLEAMQKTIDNVGRSILTSALILFAGTVGITLISKIGTTSELTNMIGRGALISMALIYLGLPALLVVLDKLIGWTTIGWVRNKKKF